MKIHEAIRCRRKELNLTLEEVGNACGVTKSAVFKWERGAVSSVKSDVLLKLAAVLKCNPLELIEEDVEKLGEMPLNFVNETASDDEIRSAVIERVEKLSDEQAVRLLAFLEAIAGEKA